MKNGLTLTEFAAEIERRAKNKRDLVTNTKNLEMTPKAHIVVKSSSDDFKVNDIAHGQLATILDIPKKYYDRMLADDPELLATNVNKWFAKDQTNQMLRLLDGNLRAVMSDKYRPLENEDLAEAVLPPLLDMDVDIMSCQLTERKLYIKAVDKRVTRELTAKGGKFGDGQHNIVRVLAPAITISNSEVGMGALSVLGGVYDGWCSNLASFGERSRRKYHVGSRHELGEENVYELLSDETKQKTDAALWAQIGDVVRAAFNRAKFDALCDKIAETTTQVIEGDPVKVVSLTTKRLGMTDGEGTSVLRHLIEGGDLTRFGLYNAVTRASQDLDDYDKASDFERAGGQLIELPANEWRELAKAA